MHILSGESVESSSLTRREGRARRYGFIQRVLMLASLARQRRRLGELPDHLLEDVGISRDAAIREARRPIWDAPDHWKLR